MAYIVTPERLGLFAWYYLFLHFDVVSIIHSSSATAPVGTNILIQASVKLFNIGWIVYNISVLLYSLLSLGGKKLIHNE